MSDSDDDVSHVFDQTNGVIAASGGEADGALSGRTTADVEDPTGSKVAGSAPPADDRDDRREGDRDERREQQDDRDRASATAAAASAGAAATTDRDEDRRAPGDETRTADPLSTRSADGASTRDEEHTYAVDARGTATDEGATRQQEADGYSGATAVAAQSAADDGRDEGSTRAESSTRPVDDASHTGRLADAYDAGPAAEADRSAAEADRDRTSGSSTAAAYAAGPAQQAGDQDVRGDDRATGVDDDEGRQRGSEGSLSALDDGSIGHVFDQTNGVIDGAEGESDGTADGDTASRAERGL